MSIHTIITIQVGLIDAEIKQKNIFFEFGIYGLLGEGDDENEDDDTDEEEENEDDEQSIFLSLHHARQAKTID